MSPELQPGLSFEWSYTVPTRATVPQLYHERCVSDPARFDARLAQKMAKAAA
jgi:hypothetical protein